MYLLGEQPAYADLLTSRLQAVPAQLLDTLPPSGPIIEIDSSSDLSQALPSDQVFIVESGVVLGVVDNRHLFYLQEGDLFGLQQGLDLTPCLHTCKAKLRLIPYQRCAALKHMAADDARHELFVLYLLGQSTLLADALARLDKSDVRPPKGFRHYAAGEVLIQQGDIAEHVFIILEGHAEAWVNGEKVGDIVQDEVFGAMAVFTKERRSATVIASQYSTVMVIPQEQFLDLMQSNPRIAHRLIESMARCIDTLNKQVIQMRSQIHS